MYFTNGRSLKQSFPEKVSQEFGKNGLVDTNTLYSTDKTPLSIVLSNPQEIR